MESPKEVSSERKFLHDIASPLTVMRLTLERVIHLAKTDPAALKESNVLQRLEKVMFNLKRIEEAHADRRAEIYVEETKT